MCKPTQITTLFEQAGDGQQEAVSALFALFYQQLRRQARYLMSHEGRNHTLQPTALVNEAFLKMAGGESVTWKNRRHFYNAATDAMRKILVDYARRKGARKRGGKLQFIGPDELEASHGNGDGAIDMERLDLALASLHKLDERRYRVVMYRYFAGLPEDQIAQLLDVGVKTVQRDWQTARIFLLAEIKNADSNLRSSHEDSSAGRAGRPKRR
jgi:RNA polymerase sigma factor (TIGR02999 family)